jgi:hypothetical protein
MQVLPIKRPNSCGIRAPYCDALCAAVMTHFLHLLSARSGSVFRQLRETVCAGYAGCCAGKRVLCVQQWFGWAPECTRLSFERRGAALCCVVH